MGHLLYPITKEIQTGLPILLQQTFGRDKDFRNEPAKQQGCVSRNRRRHPFETGVKLHAFQRDVAELVLMVSWDAALQNEPMTKAEPGQCFTRPSKVQVQGQTIEKLVSKWTLVSMWFRYVNLHLRRIREMMPRNTNLGTWIYHINPKLLMPNGGFVVNPVC